MPIYIYIYIYTHTYTHNVEASSRSDHIPAVGQRVGVGPAVAKAAHAHVAAVVVQRRTFHEQVIFVQHVCNIVALKIPESRFPGTTISIVFHT